MKFDADGHHQNQQSRLVVMTWALLIFRLQRGDTPKNICYVVHANAQKLESPRVKRGNQNKATLPCQVKVALGKGLNPYLPHLDLSSLQSQNKYTVPVHPKHEHHMHDSSAQHFTDPEKEVYDFVSNGLLHFLRKLARAAEVQLHNPEARWKKKDETQNSQQKLLSGQKCCKWIASGDPCRK